MSVTTYLGVDLGSTTTKAVVLDEDGAVIGRGITNSRANYDVACGVAAEEALSDARLQLLGADLRARQGGGALVAVVERLVRLARHLARIDEFEREVLGEIDAQRFRDRRSALETLVAAALEAMRADAYQIHGADAEERSDFFRDVASSRFMAVAERMAPELEIPFELAATLFDRVILEVENRVSSTAFSEVAACARELVGDARACGELDEPAREAARAAFERVQDREIEIGGSVGTGYGRARLPFPPEAIRSEILCHGLGAHAMFPRTATVLDIGGQDTKAIQVDERGVVTSFQMNDRCAAGCGRYLGYIADELNMGLHELGPLAMSSRRQVKVSSTCTVFAGAELRERLSLGEKREDILAGLHRAIILRAASLLSRSGGVKQQFTFTGGVAKNPAAVAALRDVVRESWGEQPINIAPDSIFTGALGAALFSRRDRVGQGGGALPIELNRD